MIDLILIALVVVTLIILFLFWYAKYTAKSGFSKDENQNDIPELTEDDMPVFKRNVTLSYQRGRLNSLILQINMNILIQLQLK